MNKPVKILSVSLLLAGALYIGVKGYIYFNVKSELDDAIAMAGPFVQIEYGGISSGLDGRIAIEDIDIAPRGLEDRLHVDSLSVQWPHFGYLFSGFRGTPAQVQELPPDMTLVLEGLRLATTGPLVDSFQRQQKQRLAGMSPGGKAPDPCDLYGTFGGEDYRAIGYDELILDASVGYELDDASPQVAVHLDYRMRGMQALSMDLTLTGVSQPAAMMMGVIPRLRDYTASFRVDPEFMTRATTYCAALRNQSRTEFIQTLANETGAGFVPGPGMREAIKNYLENPGEVLISMRPSQPLDVTTLAHYRPEDIVGLLGLKVQLNGRELRDLSFDFSVSQNHAGTAQETGPTPDTAGPDVGGSAAAPGAGSARQPPQTLAANQRRKSPAPRARFLTTQTKDLKRYLGRDVRLHTHTRKTPRRGILVSIKGGNAHVEQRVHSGAMTTYVPLSDIKTAEVFRRPRRN